MRRNSLDPAKRIANSKETVDLFVSWLRSTRGSEMVYNAFVISENHGGSHVGG